jgi:hypothetical protein
MILCSWFSKANGRKIRKGKKGKKAKKKGNILKQSIDKFKHQKYEEKRKEKKRIFAFP